LPQNIIDAAVDNRGSLAHRGRMPADSVRTMDARPVRELSADLYRVVAVVIVVIGHWLVSAVTYRDGRFGNEYPLDTLPWTQWLTLVFQVVPVFFLVGGYASAASWARWRAEGLAAPDWIRQRLGAILGPTTAYVVLVLATVGVLGLVGIGGSPLSFGGWAVAMHLWFIPVYLVVLALTPVATAAHRRWGLLVPVLLAAAVAAVDIAGQAAHVPGIGPANYLLCWGVVYQLGICWHSGALRGRPAGLLSAVAAVAVAILLGLGWYPISMVGAPGAAAQNNFPPNFALLAFATAQTALLVAVAPAVTRRLARARWLAVANSKVMAVYLWQMVPVVVVALVGYPTGLLPQPAPGTASWFWFRLGWLVILVVVLAVELTLVWLARSVFDRPLPAIAVGLPAWCSPVLLAAGIGVAVVVLVRFAVYGFAAGGRFPVLYAVLYAVAIALLSLGVRRREAS
jgi:surface polysaccharide O-acyltransferase-like enzyme